ncbi:MAG: FkbM family methyltransferase, partial [Acetobacteraceae bacterium]|nr:FkbM family methyltransferase [Acetobacteraceae bacterium]
MTFVSYAQNMEDVVLWRALRHVQNGFYIDVGAWDPREDSVTLAFYERGWNGINVEPDPKMFAKLEAERPRDINLQFALADEAGDRPFYSFPETGWSTLDPLVARRHQEAGARFEQHQVRLARLADICDLHAPPEIHFLKIDVEGAEPAVLKGADLARHRPWIIVVEATRPNSPEENHAAWEGIVTGAGYRPAYFDGLNRYYVAEEKAEALLPNFGAPPNVFDDYISMSALRKTLLAHDAEHGIPELAERFAEVREHEVALHQGALAHAAAKVKAAELLALDAQMQARLARADSKAADTEAARGAKRAPPQAPAKPGAGERASGGGPRRKAFYDAGLLLHFGFKPPVGIVRVEQYVAELLSREASIDLRFVIFDGAIKAYRALSADEQALLDEILFNRYGARERPPAPVESAPRAPRHPDPEPTAPEFVPRRGVWGRLATASRISRETFDQIMSEDLKGLLPIQADHPLARRIATRALRRTLAGAARTGHVALASLADSARTAARAAAFLSRTDAGAGAPP